MKKSSHSKKVMKMLDKERRKKNRQGNDSSSTVSGHQRSSALAPPTTESPSVSSNRTPYELNSKEKIKTELKDNSNSIQTEIRTDDFVVRLLLSIFYIFPMDLCKRFYPKLIDCPQSD